MLFYYRPSSSGVHFILRAGLKQTPIFQVLHGDIELAAIVSNNTDLDHQYESKYGYV